jgi:hypothetical protein
MSFELFPEPGADDQPSAPTARRAAAPPASSAAAASSAERASAAGSSAAKTPVPGKSSKAAAATAKPQRKQLSELTTATAQRQRPVGYREHNPIEGEVAPIEAQEVDLESQVRVGGEVSTRRYRSLNMYGDIDLHFDASDYPATDDYRARLEREPVDGPDEGFDPLIEEELDVRARLRQPPESIMAFRDDLANPEFVRGLTGERIVPRQPPLQVLHEQARPGVTAAVAARAADAMTREAARVDFFAAQRTYNLPGPMREAREREQRAAQEANFRAVLEQLDFELINAPTGAGAGLRQQLEQERALLQLDRPAPSDSAASSETPATSAQSRSAAAATAEEALLEVEAARDLFSVNPLELLPTELRGNFMSLPEISAVWRLLYPSLLQAERHRVHVNAVELVRAMALCGAKFDGSIRLATRARLGELLDREFYGGDLDGVTLCGGHEHYESASARTTLIIFKFYVVRRTKDNVALLGRAMEEQTKASAAKPATEARAANRAGADFMQLNARGLLDLEPTQALDTESDGTEAEGTQHSIRYLAREFMFCVRVVCVEPPACDCHDDNDEFYPSETDEPGVNDTNVSFFEKSAAPDSSDDDEDGALDLDLSDDDEEESAWQTGGGGGGDASDAAFFVHSDDEEHVELARYKRSTHESAPTAALHVPKRTAEHCVGKWKADVFAFQINTHVLKRLCVRSFLFYSDANVERRPS